MFKRCSFNIKGCILFKTCLFTYISHINYWKPIHFTIGTKSSTVNPLYNVCVMTLKWICCCNELVFISTARRVNVQYMQKQCADLFFPILWPMGWVTMFFSSWQWNHLGWGGWDIIKVIHLWILPHALADILPLIASFFCIHFLHLCSKFSSSHSINILKLCQLVSG